MPKEQMGVEAISAGKRQVLLVHSDDEELKLDHTEKLTRLEVTVNEHSKSLASLVPAVAGIEKNLRDIKWCAIGAATAFIVQKVGLIEVLKGVLKL